MVRLKLGITKTRTVLVATIIAIAISTVQGCQSVVPTVVGPSVKYYCTLPIEAREIVRQGIDSRTSPNKGRIECYGETQ